MRLGIDKAFELGQRKALAVLLPDVCQIQPTEGGTVDYSTGVAVSTTVSKRTYNSSENIPCRIDISRAFRPAELKQESTETIEYSLELPFDMTVETSDKVIIDGVNYIIRKLSDDTVWDITRQAIIQRIGKDAIS